MENTDKIAEIAKVKSSECFAKVTDFIKPALEAAYEMGFYDSIDYLCKMPWNEALQTLTDRCNYKKQMRTEHLASVDAYYLSQMPEDEYIRQLRERGEDIDEYMRIHHPEREDS